MLGEFLEKNAPDVSVQVVIKSNEDWGDYIDSVSNYLSYHFKHFKQQLFCAGMSILWFLWQVVPLHLHAWGRAYWRRRWLYRTHPPSVLPSQHLDGQRTPRPQIQGQSGLDWGAYERAQTRTHSCLEDHSALRQDQKEECHQSPRWEFLLASRGAGTCIYAPSHQSAERERPYNEHRWWNSSVAG